MRVTNCFVLISDAKVGNLQNIYKFFRKKMMQKCKDLIYVKKCNLYVLGESYIILTRCIKFFASVFYGFFSMKPRFFIIANL